MNGPRHTFDERLKAITGTLGVLVGLLALVPQLSKNISDAIDAVIKLPPTVRYFASMLLLAVGVFALRDGLARRSRLLRPEALLLKADKPEHLQGREGDIERLSALCHEYQQVNLVGESGAGESALIRAGLWPRLQAERKWFPIYLNVWRHDWEAGPRNVLVLALWAALSDEDRRTMEFTELPKPEHLVSTLQQVRAKLGRTPRLIFDQFDDYQTRHRSQFLAGRRRTWLPTSRLITVNSFWRGIKEVIDNYTVHCLFATRTDTADGLESIRFTTPQVYRLDRLNVDNVLPLLTELTANVEGVDPVVFAPDRGWERLKGRLARDLSQDGAVLPVQMKIAFHGLASLRSLTVGDYERAGGVGGLQAAHVERHVASTAIHSGLSKTQVWILDHDYLCRGMLEAERRANPWFVSAQEGYRDFRNAGSNTRRKWRSLLRLRQQMVLLTQRVRGRFRYGPLRAYAVGNKQPRSSTGTFGKWSSGRSRMVWTSKVRPNVLTSDWPFSKTARHEFFWL